MQSEKGNVTTAETLMQQVEELLLMGEISEEAKCEILRNVLSILEE